MQSSKLASPPLTHFISTTFPYNLRKHGTFSFATVPTSRIPRPDTLRPAAPPKPRYPLSTLPKEPFEWIRTARVLSKWIFSAGSC
ncbi:hypothetical protein SAMN04487926_105247 [Paraburkholderia steynii]|uniref:Uncharacterized protein n=1 Tax=Paraburkholderia steynii TaxID=1245441 RepID=A0A7Z7B4E3_9BURK|nr:hypothetical protein SAMN04487926_105247 [Paraburkholderia steynii]